jgi:hypothetical protein
VHKHTVGLGSNPGSTKEPLANVQVKVYDKSQGSCVMQYGVNWANYEDIWNNCEEELSAKTDEFGVAYFNILDGDYIAIAPYGLPGQETFMGGTIGMVQCGMDKVHQLQFIQKADGSKVPAKFTKKKGSVLGIVEPEYVEWDGTQEDYPFILEGLELWDITVEVAPPEGYVASDDSLEATVDTAETDTVQFTIIEVGSVPGPVDVTYTIEHNGRREQATSRIGMRMTPEFAKAKGLTPEGLPRGKAVGIREEKAQGIWDKLTGQTIFGVSPLALGIIIAGLIILLGYFFYLKPKYEGGSTGLTFKSKTKRRK